jgi:hypothetical protein
MGKGVGRTGVAVTIAVGVIGSIVGDASGGSGLRIAPPSLPVDRID